MSNTIIVIADVHLSLTSPKRNQLFFEFLKQLERPKALFILGDLFDVWVGDDDNNSTIDECRQALRNLSDSGIPLFIQRGNRDFMLGIKWFKQTTSTVLPDWYVLKHNGQQLLMTHGDLLVDNKKYLRTRSIITNPIIKLILQQTPLKLRRKLAERLRDKSDGNFIISNPDSQKIADKLAYYQCNILLYGHFHQAQMTPFSSDNSQLHCCLPHWQDTVGGYATIKDGKLDLHTYP